MDPLAVCLNRDNDEPERACCITCFFVYAATVRHQAVVTIFKEDTPQPVVVDLLGLMKIRANGGPRGGLS